MWSVSVIVVVCSVDFGFSLIISLLPFCRDLQLFRLLHSAGMRAVRLAVLPCWGRLLTPGVQTLSTKMNLVDELNPKLENMNREELLNTLQSVEALLVKIKEMITPHASPDPVPPPLSSTPLQPSLPSPATEESLFQFLSNPLDDGLLQEVEAHIKSLKYTGNNKRSHTPEIFLYGASPYIYNAQSAATEPVPIQQVTIMENLLEAVNTELGTTFNSMLINKYREKRSALGFHKDDEKCLVPSASIATLSFGAVRNLEISLTEDKENAVMTQTLTPYSIFVMKPGFQQKYWHALAPGKNDEEGEIRNPERGPRYSITFRTLLLTTPLSSTSSPTHRPSTAVSTPPQHVPDSSASITDVTPPSDPTTTDTPDTFVFGSSLLQGLDVKMLSKHTKSFKVICRRGAHVRDIIAAVKGTKEDLDTTKVSNVFLLVGGNDVENLQNDSDLESVFEDIKNLVNCTRVIFPSASINLISLVPRKAKYLTHIRNMNKFNNWARDFCMEKAIRFVDIFTFFLVKTPTIWWLNRRLFNGSKLHFNATGNSVLAKVLIAVANRPRQD